MDKESCISLLNSYIKNYTVPLGKKILELYFEDKNIPRKEEIITAVLGTPSINGQCINITIEQLCRDLKINSITKNNQIILFY